MTEREVRRKEEQRLDALAEVYLSAIDRQDLDAIEDLWKQAETDAALAEMLHELHAELVKEEDEGRS